MPENTLLEAPPGDDSLPSQEQETPQAPQQDVVAGPLINQDGSFAPDWTNRLEADLQHPDLKNYKNVNDLIRSHVHQQRLIGKKGIIPPTEKSTPQEIAEYRRQIGAPENEGGYQINAEGVPEGVQVSEELANKFRQIANKHHMPAPVWKDLSDAFLEVEKMRHEIGQKMTVETANKRYNDGVAELQRTWGRDYQANLDLVKAFVSHPDIAIDPNDPGLSYPGIVKGIARAAKMMSSDKFMGPGTAPQHETDPEALALDIIGNPNNADHARYHNQDKDVQSKVENLLAQAERRKALRGYR